MAQVIQLRRDYSSNWTLANPVLAQGELGIEFDNYNVKIGNGLSSWNELPYGLGTVSLPVHTHPYAGTGITTASTAGINIAGTLDTNGLSLGIPSWLTTYNSVGGGDWTAATVSGTDMLISTGAGTNTLYYPKYLTTAADPTHDHTQYLTTAAMSNHTHSDLYVNTSVSGSFLTTAALSNHSHSLNQVTSVGSDVNILMGGYGINFQFPNSVSTNATREGAFEIDAQGAFQGDLVHIHQHVGNPNATFDLVHLQADASAGTGLRIELANHTNQLPLIIHGGSQAMSISLESQGVPFKLNQSASNSVQYLNAQYLQGKVSSEFQSTGNYLTTAMLSNAGSLYQLTSDNSLSLGTGYTTHTHTQSTHPHPYIASESTSVFAYTSNDNLSLGTGYTTHTHNYQSQGAYLTTAAVSDHTHSNLYLPLGNSSAYQTSVLSNSFQTTGAYLTTAMLSGNTSLYVNTSERGNYYYTSNNTFANSTHAHGGLTINATNISTSITSASNGLTINLSAAAPGAGGGVAVAAAGATITNSTVVFSNSNGVSFGANGSTITASIPIGTVNFVDSNGISWGSSVNGVSTTITGSVNAGAGGVAVVASNTTYTSGSVSFRGTNVTIGTSAGGQFIDLSVAAIPDRIGTNTSISSGHAGSQLAMAANTSGLTLSVPAWLTIAGGAAAYTDMEWHNFTGNSTHQAPGQNTIWYQPFELKNPVSASSLQIGMTFNGTSTSAATQQFGMTHDFMILARNATNSTRFDSIWSTRNELTVWASGTTSGSYSSNNGDNSLSNGSRLVGSYIYGQRIISNAIGSELSAGFYMFAYRQSTSTAAYSALMRSYNPVFVAPLPQAKNFIGFQTNTSVGHFIGGPYSVSSDAFPSSIGVSELRKSNDLRLFFKIGATS